MKLLACTYTFLWANTFVSLILKLVLAGKFELEWLESLCLTPVVIPVVTPVAEAPVFVALEESACNENILFLSENAGYWPAFSIF